MKDKVITISSMGDFFVIEELNYNNKKYILCHSLQEEIKSTTINLALFEVKIQNNNLSLDNVEDETAKIIIDLMTEKLQQNN